MRTWASCSNWQDVDKLRNILKPAPALVLVVLVHHKGLAEEWSSPRYAVGVIVGLVLCGLGDTLLEGESTFTSGLVVFLVAHLTFAAAFSQPSRLRSAESTALVAPGLAARSGRETWPKVNLIAAGPFLFAATVFAVYFGAKMLGTDDSGNYAPLVVYAFALGVAGWRAAARIGMGTSASDEVEREAARVQPESQRLQWVAVAGIAFFMASDGVLAANRFLGKIEFADSIIMTLYWFALAFVAQSVPVVQVTPL